MQHFAAMASNRKIKSYGPLNRSAATACTASRANFKTLIFMQRRSGPMIAQTAQGAGLSCCAAQYGCALKLPDRTRMQAGAKCNSFAAAENAALFDNKMARSAPMQGRPPIDARSMPDRRSTDEQLRIDGRLSGDSLPIRCRLPADQFPSTRSDCTPRQCVPAASSMDAMIAAASMQTNSR